MDPDLALQALVLQEVFGDEEDVSLEDVVTACEITVLHEVVYIAPVPAVFAAPAFAALQHLRHRTSPYRDRSICASGGILCASSCSVDELSSGCCAERRAAR